MMRGALAALVLGVMVSGAIPACARHASDRGAVMPGYAPDSTPLAVQRELRRPENILVDPPGISGRVVKNALYVRFADSAREPEQVAALRTVGGVVVGGLRMSGGEFYHIRIDVPRDSGAGPLLRARDRLRALPQVKVVLLDAVGTFPER